MSSKPNAQLPTGLVGTFRSRTDRMLADLERLVSLESPTADREAAGVCASAVAEMGRPYLGSAPELIEVADCVHLRWRFGGARPSVLLLGHYDTVWPIGTLREIPWQVQKTSSGDRATGPGCLDMKAGLVQMFHALSLLPQCESLCVLITGDEELGSPTSRELIESEARRASATLVLEPAGPGGAVKLERKGVSIYDVEIRGRAAHSGLAPELGVNAGIELAHQILRVSDLGDAAVGTTVVPTASSAGSSRNTVPAVARLAVDARFWQVDEMRRIDVAMGSLGPVLAEAHVDVRGGVNRPPMEASSSAPLFRLAQEVSAALGLATPAGCRVGGASDGNLAAAAGSLTLDGLGAVGDGAHARDEYVEVGAMADRSALLCALVPAIQDSADFGSRHA